MSYPSGPSNPSSGPPFVPPGQQPPPHPYVQQPYAQPGYGQHPASFYQTQVQSGRPAGDTTFSGWATSALVLGILCVLIYAVVTLGFVALSTLGHSSELVILGLLDLFVAIAFATGGLGSVMREDWGRRIVVIAAGLAILMVVIGLIITFTSAPPAAHILFTSPGFPQHPVGFPQQPMFPGNPAFPPPPSFQPNPAFTEGFQVGSRIGALFGSLIKVVYCGLLMQFMLSPRARASVTR